MDFGIETTGICGEMTFSPPDDQVMNNIFLSLSITKGTFFARPDFGMRPLTREKNTDQTAALAREYCLEALQWLLDSGKVTAIEVAVERDMDENPNRLKILVQAIKADLSTITFQTYQEVV
jgi:phage gp46-like protein